MNFFSSKKHPNPISIKLVNNWTVTANLPPQKETLSGVDEWLTKASHWLGFSIRMEGCPDPEKVVLGLERTLYHIPALGARVIADSKKLYNLEILPDPSQQGVVFEHYKGTTSQKDIHLPDASDCRATWKAAGLEAPGPGFSGESGIEDPLLRARLISFDDNNVSYLCIGINHGICDGSGICDMLETWSHFTTHDDASSLPEHLSQRRVFGKRDSTAHRPAKSIDELYTRLETEVGCPHDPFSVWTFWGKLLPKAIWCMARQEELELRLNAEKLKDLKKRISEKLPEGEWVSTFEVLVASVLLAREITADHGNAQPISHTLHVACDLRGRSKRFPEQYFGNAAYDFREPMTLALEGRWSLDQVTSMAQEVHRAIRSGLADAESNACKAKDWFDAARRLGLKNTNDIWSPVVFDALEGKGTFVNSWDARWLNCKMDEVPASSMAAFFGTLQNLIVDIPRDHKSGDSTLYLALPPNHGKAFRSFCQQHTLDLPFEIIS